MKTIIIKITRKGNRIGPFDIKDQLGNVIASNVPIEELIDGVGYSVSDDVVSITLISVGKCTTEETRNVGVVYPSQLTSSAVVTNTACLWSHLVFNLFNSYYGHTEPYTIEYPFSYSFQDQILQNVKDYTRAYQYFDDGTGVFDYSNKIETDDFYFNRAVVYNNQQSSGMLELVPKPKHNLSSYMSYPIYRSDRKTITFTKSDNFYQYNNFWSIVKSKTTPLFTTSCESLSVDKIVNQSNMDYSSRSFQKDTIRAKYVKIRHTLDNRSDVHLVSQFIIAPSQISYK
jgi:hypothetical protein